MDIDGFNHKEILVVRTGHHFTYLLLVHILVRLVVFPCNFGPFVLFTLFQLLDELTNECDLIDQSFLLRCIHLCFNFTRRLDTYLHFQIVYFFLLLHHFVSRKYLLASFLLSLWPTVAGLRFNLQALHGWRNRWQHHIRLFISVLN